MEYYARRSTTYQAVEISRNRFRLVEPALVEPAGVRSLQTNRSINPDDRNDHRDEICVQLPMCDVPYTRPGGPTVAPLSMSRLSVRPFGKINIARTHPGVPNFFTTVGQGCSPRFGFVPCLSQLLRMVHILIDSGLARCAPINARIIMVRALLQPEWCAN